MLHYIVLFYFSVLMFTECLCLSGCVTNRYSELVQVECYGINFSMSGIPYDVTHLMMNCNQSKSVPNITTLNPFQELLFFSITDCAIAIFPDDMFHNLPKLKVVQLKQLSIETLPPHMFQNSASIEQLNLIELQNLTSVSYFTLSDQLGIKEISLIKLRLSCLKLWPFLTMVSRSLEALLWIDSSVKLPFNEIYFSNFRLKKLVLLGNNINNVQFLKNTPANRINLNNNNVDNRLYVSNYTKSITLSFNKIDGMFPRAYKGPGTNVEYLNVDNNKITGFGNDFSIMFPKLKHLDASFNRILRITDSLKSLFKSGFIDFSGNFLFCDCGMNDLLTSINVSKHKIDCNIAILTENKDISVPETKVSINVVSKFLCTEPKIDIWIYVSGNMVNIQNIDHLKANSIIDLYQCEYLQFKCVVKGDPLPSLVIDNPNEPLVSSTLLHSNDPVTVSSPLLIISHSRLSNIWTHNYITCTGINNFGTRNQTVIFRKMKGFRPKNVFQEGIMLTYLCDKNAANLMLGVNFITLIVLFLTFVM